VVLLLCVSAPDPDSPLAKGPDRGKAQGELVDVRLVIRFLLLFRCYCGIHDATEEVVRRAVVVDAFEADTGDLQRRELGVPEIAVVPWRVDSLQLHPLTQ